jgi:hypothetical protein
MHALTSQIQKNNQQKIATETRETQNKALKMKNSKSIVYWDIRLGSTL